MTDNFFHAEGKKLVKALPIYLGVQAVTLLMTFLDTPAYLDAYQENHNMPVTGWIAFWLLLFAFGLTTGILLLISKTWKIEFSQTERGKLAGGYLLGAIAGLLTLGLRFMPVMPYQYFFVIGGLALVLALVYILWIRRRSHLDEIFP
jgi:hypothetical protein